MSLIKVQGSSIENFSAGKLLQVQHTNYNPVVS